MIHLFKRIRDATLAYLSLEAKDATIPPPRHPVTNVNDVSRLPWTKIIATRRSLPDFALEKEWGFPGGAVRPLSVSERTVIARLRESSGGFCG